MRVGGSKEKGSSYEREVGEALSLWLSSGERSDLVSRTELSGGKFTVTGKGNAGDLHSSHPQAFPFFNLVLVECKFWQDLNLLKFLRKKGDLYWYYEQVEKQSKQTKKFNLMVVKQNRHPSLFICPVLPLFLSLPNTTYLFHYEVFVGLFEEFLKLSPDSFMEEVQVYLDVRGLVQNDT